MCAGTLLRVLSGIVDGQDCFCGGYTEGFVPRLVEEGTAKAHLDLFILSAVDGIFVVADGDDIEECFGGLAVQARGKNIILSTAIAYFDGVGLYFVRIGHGAYIIDAEVDSLGLLISDRD